MFNSDCGFMFLFFQIIKMIAAIISTAFLVMTAMFAIQEVGVLHDFIMTLQRISATPTIANDAVV